MTHLEKFIALYEEFGIELEIEKNDKGSMVLLWQGSDEKLTGYSMFFSAVQFDKDGNFIEQGFWE